MPDDRRLRRLPRPARHRTGGSSRPTAGRNPSPGCGPGWSRSTGPATGTWPPPSARAGKPTTCACTAWTSRPACGPCSTCSPTAPRACCPPRPNTRPASCPPWPTSSGSRPAGAPTPAAPPRPGPEQAMTDATLRQALAFATLRLAGPALPARPEDPRHHARLPRRHHRRAADHRLVRPPPRLEPGHRHRRPRPRRPGRRPARPGRERVPGVPPAPRAPGCWTARPSTCAPPAAACTPTSPAPRQRNGHLPAHHLDFRSARRLHPDPALPDRRPALPAHQPARRPGQPRLGRRHPAAATPAPAAPAAAAAAPDPGHDIGHLARWVAAQPEGNRNAGLFWAANRALDTDPAADLSPLADAARQAGLPDPEITRTLNSARRTSGTHSRHPDHQAEVS